LEPCGIENPIVPPPPPLEPELELEPPPPAPEPALELELEFELEPQAASANVVMSTVTAAISRRRGNMSLILGLSLLLNEWSLGRLRTEAVEQDSEDQHDPRNNPLPKR
jgi:hypothetical protein